MASEMGYIFSKHYSVEEARALLPQIRKWLDALELLTEEIATCEKRMQGLLSSNCDLGGRLVNEWIRAIVNARSVADEFNTREIQVKDFNRGLVDFPAIIGGREVFLCWEKSEADIEFWHDIDAGYAGREPL